MVAASLLAILLAPVAAVVAVLVALRLGRPVLFRQARPGRHGRPFVMIKFRTMHTEESASGPAGDRHRLTRFGLWLRSTSLDELPSLWNVIRGEMSLVGPRPLLLGYLGRYTPEQARRHEVRPGITGLAQVNGRNALDWEERFSYDTWYVDNRSLRLDLRILLATARTVVARRGIAAPGTPTAHEFHGTAGPSRQVADLSR
ncbi:sugar transferase [Micromonospora endolithica]|uniref:Sugar transferase n=1 Tax=Micromonospora endolithica TaxID=230091 RepID=A0A3A9ZB40_9ACTN|nr:sugar transferase [Micromonospora endolithica]